MLQFQLWPCAKLNIAKKTIELANTQKLLNKGLSLVSMASNTKQNKILNDLNMFTTKVSRQYKRPNDPLRLNRPDG